MKAFATQLRHERKLHAWSQEHLAEMVGTTVRSVSRWERGSAFPNCYFRQKLTELFGKSTSELGLLEATIDTSAQPVVQGGTDQPLLPACSDAFPRLWNLPHPRNPLFTGREAILTEIHRALHYEQTGAWLPVQAITGLGGMGKTQTALEYAYRFAESYQRTFWLCVEARETLYAQMVALAEALHLFAPEGQPLHAYIEAIKGWLGDHSDWLLIMDNLEELTLLREVLPAPCRGHILVTTRTQATGPGIKRLDLAKMAPEEGALLLLRRAKRLDPAACLEQATGADRRLAITLAERLDGLPLALDQAGAYIEEAACSLEHYAVLFQRHRDILLGLRDLSGGTNADHPRSVRATLALSLERLQRENPAALALLQLCAFLHAEAIPEELLQCGASELGSLVESLVGDPLQLDVSMADLRRYSLLQRDPEGHSISLHRLVQVVVQDTLEETAQRRWAEGVVRLLNRVFPQQVEYTNWERCQWLLPHALRCAKLIEEWHCTFPEAARLLHGTGYYLWERGAYAQALPLYQRALDLREHTLGPDHPDVAGSLNSLAALYYVLGRYEEALPLFERALAIRERVLESPHPDVAESLNNLALLAYKQGRYEHALPLFQRALTTWEQTLGPDHPHVATTLNNLALLYQNQGRSAEALLLFERTLAIDEQTLGPDHPGVATDLNNLAELYREQGQYNQAISFHRRALAIREQTLESTHPDLAQSLNNLAILYREQGQYKEALPLHQRALAIREQALGPSHPLVATSLHSLATFYCTQGQYVEALPLYQRALALDEQAYGSTHPEVANDLNSLAVLYRKLGQYEQALPLVERALAIRKQALGADHPAVGRSLNNLAEFYREQEQYEQAMVQAQRALAILEQALGPTHPDVAESLNTLAALYQAQGQYEQALPLYQRVLTIREQVLGPTHPTISHCLDQYAALLHTLQRPIDAQVLEV
jgi:tetratricopeptide (TPR) repeat protein/DNA-binding XRE family transcriptional regulator